MGKNQKDKKEGKQENKAAAPSQGRKLQEKEIEEKEDTHLKNWGQMIFYPSLEKWKDMKMLQAVPRRQNMTMCFLHWLRLRMMPQWRDS